MPNEQDILSFIEQGFQQDEFLKLVSHELRTPLTGLQLEAQTFKRFAALHGAEAYSKARVDRLVHTMESQSRELSSLIKAMLDLTQLRSSGLQLDRQKINFTQLITNLCDGLDLDLSCSKNHWVFGDEERLKEAIKFQIAQFLNRQIIPGPQVRLFGRKGTLYLQLGPQEGTQASSASNDQRHFEMKRGIPFKELRDSSFRNYLSYETIRRHEGTIKVENDFLKISLPTVESL